MPAGDGRPHLLHYPRLDRMPGGSEDPDAAGDVLDDARTQTFVPLRRSAVKKSSARIPQAWKRRNSAQLGRPGAVPVVMCGRRQPGGGSR